MASRAFSLSCAVAALLSSTSVFAQTAGAVTGQLPGGQSPGGAGEATPGGTVDSSTNVAPSSDGSTDATIGDIIVTAQKREENVQRTPIAITALTSQLNSRAGVRDFTDIQKVAPDVSIFAVAGAVSIAIRGVRQTALGPTNDTTTATHLDGVYLSRPTGLAGMFYDIQRIEVLKGPQGTLYGRNATGGAVNIITNKPTDEYGARGEFEVGNYRLYRAEAAINLPIADFLAVRVAAHDFGHDGYYSNGQDNDNQKGARFEALFKMSTRAKLLLTADYELSDTRQDGIALFAARINGSGDPPQAIPIPANPFTASPTIYPYGVTQYNQVRSEVYGFNAQLDLDLQFATLTAQAGRRHLNANGSQPDEGGTLIPVDLSGFGHQRTPSRSDTTSGEVRLASASTRPLQWLVGAFYFTENFSGELCQLPTLDVQSPCVFRVSNSYNSTKSFAFFGQATYTPPILGDALHVTGGIRYSKDKKVADTSTAVGPPDPPPAPSNILTDLRGITASFAKVTYRAALAYDITPANLIYASFSTGFRAGGFAYGSTPVYKPETIKAYEVGSKNRFFHNRVQLNLEAWKYDYTNTEQNVIQLGGPPFFRLLDLSVQSIGSVKYKGATAQLDLAVTKHDHLAGFVQYVDARFGSFVIPGRFFSSPPLSLDGQTVVGTPGDDSGNRVGNTPHWTGNASYDHDFDVLDGNLDFRGAMQFSSARDFATYAQGTLQYSASYTRAYQRYDVSVRYAPTAGHFNVTGYINNVANAKTPSLINYEDVRDSGLVTGTLYPPRTFGMIVGFDF